LNCLKSARKFFAACYAHLDCSKETLWIAHLDGSRRCVHLARHSGDETTVPFPLKSILRDAITFESVAILLAHNHPSGDAKPSMADIAVTRQLATVCSALGCAILDHLVFGSDGCCSLRSLGLL